ncbi:hypothetical protein [Actinoplanes siamensis]|uniref:Uncharacterized protein n=1 Tax=Actinoplanes siamensis TaxID=1223317 RepID=A0A919N9R5_9ACTN|nr:hypothetical protein [Actinoplanes siamensis]GIF06855.1 hypothetical protein Asi03nite_43930 [Actinoplanes siamensis]
MSGGEIAVLPAGLVLVPLAVVAVGAGVAATLVVKAARAGTEAAGRALEEFAAELEREADEQHDQEVRTRLWELAAGSAVRVNQELLLLAARAEKAGVRPDLPRPVDVTGCRLAGTPALVTQVRAALAGARAQIERAEADRERHTLLAALPVPAAGSPSAAELLAHHQRVLARRGTVPAVRPEPAWTAPAKADGARVRAEIDAILVRLHEDATADDRALALTAAARAEQKKNTTMNTTFLEALARVVEQELNPRIARRREAATLLAGLDQPLVAEAIGDLAPPRPPCLDAVAGLRAVVRGEADLTDELRRAANSALDWALVETERRRLLDEVAEAFSGLGYDVSTGLGVGHSATLSVHRDAWRGGHSADVWIDGAGRIRSRLVQLAPQAGGEAGRCADLNDSLREVGARLGERGLEARVDLPEHPVPALKRFGRGAGAPAASPAEDTAPKARTRDHHEES